ncbi:hypothetical protein [Sphingomonas sp. BAUL-RG-20F-R05-02]|uniref:hypothetical protein n=1 Tax=Sphingomonas sp. BAUL-RG-20F-R05-02 TaxID=2914830 RepID=UPI001F58743C|nr:hypothetical protein [Sphingomonas sp. BAUL-RG-20F-R05-02]
MVSIGTTWDGTSGFISDRFGAVLRIAVPLIFVPMALLGNLMPLVGRDATPANIVFGLATLAMSIVTLWGNLALTALVIEPVDSSGAIRIGAARLPAKLLVAVIELGIVVVAAAPIFVAFALGGIVPGQMPAPGAMPTIAFGPAVFALVYSLFFTVLVLILFARLLLVDPALVAERRGVSALPRSLRLTRGLTLKLVGVLLLYIIVSQVATMATRTVFGTILGLLTLGAGPVNFATIITAILVALVQTGFSILAVIFAARLFVVVRDGREAVIELA